MTGPEAAPETAPVPVPWPATGGPQRETSTALDVVIRAAGVSISIIATVVTALLELELSSLRIGAIGALLDGRSPYEGSGAALPLVVPLTIVANWGIAWFAVTTTGRRWAAGPPWALWTLIMMLAASSRTSEGDYLLGGENWVALVTILAGSLTFAVYVYQLILSPLKKNSELTGSV
ncbi:hypothetical protein Ait01nite_007280 [Actinoplanes italicus]|uniref:Uncharacterized protein n=1 Tax=Actinoplanes italicus TaxID=113567 RepID=A0A2T0KLT6_9ACTN|nr:hypothetical protein [Actinoplanes italicus]PRX24590.1 hypothetical protein CLV67_102367 [Actinoplanes italicus]GIE27683.1 hypothetical protein Ait01nite_007280 [Actinoplanes italicus]